MYSMKRIHYINYYLVVSYLLLHSGALNVKEKKSLHHNDFVRFILCHLVNCPVTIHLICLSVISSRASCFGIR